MVFNSLFILFSYGNKKGVSLFLANIRLASIGLSFFWTAAVVYYSILMEQNCGNDALLC
jgi:hypothetical protein